MLLDRVTITGVDESIQPVKLLELSVRFPFVEWAFLLSCSKEGEDRYPRWSWIKSLLQLGYECADNTPQLAMHVCGSWAAGMVAGYHTIPEWLLSVNRCQTPIVRRVQLNLVKPRLDHFSPYEFAKELDRLGAYRSVIFQTDTPDGHNPYMDRLWEDELTAMDLHVLHDASCGSGVEPVDRVMPYYSQGDSTPAYTGYAGGFNPGHLNVQLLELDEQLKSHNREETPRIWIDVESGVRDRNKFSFELAEEFLTKAKQWVERTVKPTEAT